MFAVEEEDQGAQGGERYPWTHCPWRRVCLWCCSHLCILQWHLHCKCWMFFFSVDGPFYSLPQFKCDVVILGIDLGVAHCADLPGDLLWADHHALWAQVISNCAFGKKKWLLEFCMQREEIKNFPWFILFVPCATVGCQLLPVSCTIHFVCWLPVRKWFLLLLKVQFNEWSWNCKILLVSVGEAC